MRNPYLPFFIFSLLFTLTIPFFPETATIVGPGWHTTILPQYSLTTLVISFIVLIVTIAYWRLTKRVNKINLPLFILHLILTIPVVLFVRAPFLLFNINGNDLTVLNRQVTYTTALIATIFLLFVVGQTLFAVYYLRIVYSKKATT